MLRRLVVSVWLVAVVVGLAGPGYAIETNVPLGLGSSGLSRNSTTQTHAVAAEPVRYVNEDYKPVAAPPGGSSFYWGTLFFAVLVDDQPPAGVGWRIEASRIDASDPRTESEQLASSPMKLFSANETSDLSVWLGLINSEMLSSSHSLEPGHEYYVLYRMRHVNSSVWISTWRSQSHPAVFASSSTLPTVPAEQSGPCSCPDAQGYALDPVNTATGGFFESFVDVAGVGPGVSGEVARSYASQSNSDVGFGKGWSWLYGSRLDVSTSETAWRSPDGTVARFKKVGTSWVTPPGASGSLTQSSTGFVLRLPGGSEHRFSSSGDLQKVTDASGVGVSVTATGGVVSKVTDAVGRSTTFTTSGGRVTKARTWDGREISYGYASGRLTSVTDVRGKVTSYRYDAAGRLDRVTAPSGRVLVENTYDASGRVTRQVDGAGKVWTLTWDSSGDVATVTDPNGGKWVDTYVGRVLMSKQDPAGNVTSFEYDQDLNQTVIDAGGPTQVRQTFDARGNVLTRTAPGQTAAVQTLTYNAKDQVTSRTDYRGNKTTMAYAGNRLSSVTSPKGEVTKYTWTSLGLLASTTAPGGGVTSMSYDIFGQLASMTAPGGEVTSYTYDAAGRVASVADPRAAAAARPADYTKRIAYDEAGNVTSVTATDGAKSTLSYDVDGRLMSSQTESTTGAVLTKEVLQRDGLDRIVKKTDAAGAYESFVYDSRGNLTSETDATGARTAYSYDSRNLMASMTTARGNAKGAVAADFRWTYQYDSRGRLTKEIDPTGAATTYARDGYGAPTKITDPDGRVTSVSYDGDGNTLRVVDPLARVTSYSYDVNGRQVGVKAPGLGQRNLTYDADGNLTKKTSPSGLSVTSYTYDANGLLASVTSPRGNATTAADDFVTKFDHDPAGNVITQVNPLGQSTRTTFDGENRVLSRTSPRGGKTTWTHDGLGRTLSVTTPASATTSWTYDSVGNLTKLTNGRGKSTTYTHSPRGEVTATTDPLGRKETFTYDEEGHLIKTITARGHANGGALMDKYTIRTGYDARGLQTSTTTSSAASSSTFAYSPGGDLTKVVDATGTTTLTYDAAHQLTGMAGPMGVFAYSYSPWGEVASRTLPTHGAVTFGFDTDGRIATSSSNSETTRFGYDRDDNLTNITYPAASGVSQTRAYNSVGAATDIHTTQSGSLISRYQYLYDTNGNPVRETVSRGSTVASTSYDHDLSDRLTKECHNATSCTGATDVDTYSYNETSGITRTQHGNGVDARVRYDDADQPIKLWDARAGAEPSAPTVAFDADGYPTGNADGDIEFDPLGRMVKNEPWQATYTYNAFGNRVGVTRNGSTTELAWDNNNPLPKLAQQGPAGEEPTRTYRYDPTGAPLSSSHPSGAYGRSYFVSDRQGSVREVLKPDGATAYRHDYQAFGRQETPSKSATRVAPEIGYTGEYTDTFTGTIHLRARDYLGIGAFFAPDPITLGPPNPASNPYLYVNAGPLTMVDPSGEIPRWLEDLGAGVGHGAAGLADVALVPGDLLTGGDLFKGIRASDFLEPGAFTYSTVPTGTPTYEASRTETYAANATSFGISIFVPLDALNAPQHITNGQYAKVGPCLTDLLPGPPVKKGAGLTNPSPVAANTGSKALRPVGKYLESVDDVMTNPRLLVGKSPAQVESMIGRTPGWQVETLGKGSRQGQGWVLRQYNDAGNPTGPQIRWHPGGGHHGPDPYWRVVGPNGDLGGIIR